MPNTLHILARKVAAATGREFSGSHNIFLSTPVQYRENAEEIRSAIIDRLKEFDALRECGEQQITISQSRDSVDVLASVVEVDALSSAITSRRHKRPPFPRRVQTIIEELAQAEAGEFKLWLLKGSMERNGRHDQYDRLSSGFADEACRLTEQLRQACAAHHIEGSKAMQAVRDRRQELESTVVTR